VVVAGAHANNTAAAALLLRQHGIRPVLCLRAPRGTALGGLNTLAWRLAVPPADVHWVPPSTTTDAHQAHAHILAAALAAADPDAAPVEVLPEGASHPDAWAGALLLADDLGGAAWRHVIIDAGTGMTAAGLLVGLAFTALAERVPLGPVPVPVPVRARGPVPTVHVVVVAGGAAAFQRRLEEGLAWAAERVARVPPAALAAHLPPYHVHASTAGGRAFAPGNAATLASVVRYARSAGVLFDPVYTAKLMIETERLLARPDDHGARLDGPVLVVHTGGTWALPGFAERLCRVAGHVPPLPTELARTRRL
jgi:1-aminocyclopropane-1-carboxylate deaminase